MDPTQSTLLSHLWTMASIKSTIRKFQGFDTTTYSQVSPPHPSENTLLPSLSRKRLSSAVISIDKGLEDLNACTKKGKKYQRVQNKKASEGRKPRKYCQSFLPGNIEGSIWIVGKNLRCSASNLKACAIAHDRYLLEGYGLGWCSK
jgi:hypothetical protein